MSLVLRS